MEILSFINYKFLHPKCKVLFILKVKFSIHLKKPKDSSYNEPIINTIKKYNNK